MVRHTSTVYKQTDGIRSIVDEERKALDVAFKRVSKSKKAARAFLVSTGILTKKAISPKPIGRASPCLGADMF